MGFQSSFYFTVRVTVAVWVIPPPEPVTVIG
jgi:hypothetical protein